MLVTICTGGKMPIRKKQRSFRVALFRLVLRFNEVENKATIKQMGSMKEQIEDNVNTKLKDLMNLIKNGLKDSDKKNKDTTDGLRTRLDTLERTLGGRLSEIQALFADRAAKTYVDLALKDLEDKIKRTVVLIYEVGFEPKRDGVRAVEDKKRSGVAY